MKKIVLLLAAVALMINVNAQTTWGVKAGVGMSNYKISAEDLSMKLNPGTKTGFYVGAVNNISFSENFGLQTELLYNYEGFRIKGGSGFVGGIVDAITNHSTDPALDIFHKDLRISGNMHTLRLPIMAKFSIDGLSIMAGPYIACRVGMGLKVNDGVDGVLGQLLPVDAKQALIDNVKDVVNDNLLKFDVGAALGVEYAFCNGIFIDAKYNFSFLNSLKKTIDMTAINKISGQTTPDVKLKDVIGVQPTVKYSSIQIGVGYRF